MSKGKERVVDEPDFLDEDAPISNQKFFVLSYVLPKDPVKEQPLFKVRGSFSTIDECEKRIKKLQYSDKYFNMFIAEVGKWGTLFNEEQIRTHDIDAVYANEKMNEIIKGYKENKDKADQEYQERKEFMEKKAREEGTKEGQKKLIEEINPMKVKISMENTNQQIAKLTEELTNLRKNHEDLTKMFESFSQEEIDNSEKEFQEYRKSLEEKQ
jgi:hypothetical protein